MTDYTISRTVNEGIERITYAPHERRFATPILLQHGMWHGAWCWADWQALLATWGWESHAISLPGHGGSPVQRPLRWCTLGYYLRFLEREINRLPVRPILMGHSMGGALTQHYLKKYDDLPAAVLVAPWPSHSMVPPSISPLKIDPVGSLLTMVMLSATPLIRTPARAAKLLISPKARISPEELHKKLTPESILVIYQHNPPMWSPPKHLKTPLLWLAGEFDYAIPEKFERPSAKHYGAKYVDVPDAGHNLMMEHNADATAQTIHEWLMGQSIQ